MIDLDFIFIFVLKQKFSLGKLKILENKKQRIGHLYFTNKCYVKKQQRLFKTSNLLHTCISSFQSRFHKILLNQIFLLCTSITSKPVLNCSSTYRKLRKGRGNLHRESQATCKDRNEGTVLSITCDSKLSFYRNIAILCVKMSSV